MQIVKLVHFVLEIFLVVALFLYGAPFIRNRIENSFVGKNVSFFEASISLSTLFTILFLLASLSLPHLLVEIVRLSILDFKKLLNIWWCENVFLNRDGYSNQLTDYLFVVSVMYFSILSIYFNGKWNKNPSELNSKISQE